MRRETRRDYSINFARVNKFLEQLLGDGTNIPLPKFKSFGKTGQPEVRDWIKEWMVVIENL